MREDIHTQGSDAFTDSGQKMKDCAFTLWFTGLPASGKSTLAAATRLALLGEGHNAFVIDGDSIRKGLNKDLGFSPEHRRENIRRVGELAELFRQAGIINLVACISPYRSDRNAARKLAMNNETFVEIFVDCPLEVCEQRDPKGMYKKAHAGIIQDLTGISAPYEIPGAPEIHLRTALQSVEECIGLIMDYLRTRNLIRTSS